MLLDLNYGSPLAKKMRVGNVFGANYSGINIDAGLVTIILLVVAILLAKTIEGHRLQSLKKSDY